MPDLKALPTWAKIVLACAMCLALVGIAVLLVRTIA